MATTYRELPPKVNNEVEVNQYLNALASNAKGVFYHEEASVDIASLSDGAGATQSITVSGVELGDMVMGVSLGVDLVDMTVTAYVQAADKVEVRIQNESGSATDLASTTVRLVVYDLT